MEGLGCARSAAVAADTEGFLELVPDRPASSVEVRILPTAWEKIGWTISLLTAVSLLSLHLPFRGLRTAARTEVRSHAVSDGVSHKPQDQRR